MFVGFIHTHTTDRLWRKNRQPRSHNSCIGTDVNRNWPHYWSVTSISLPSYLLTIC